MDFAATADQQSMRAATERAVARVIAPEMARHDRNQALPKAAVQLILAELAALGFVGARLPPEVGGTGMSMVDYGLASEALPAAIAVSLIAQEVTTARLYAECNDEQRARLLPALLRAEKIACTGSTEPDTGSDPRGIRTRLTERNGKLVLNGRKMWITNVSVCDLMLATCLDQRPGGDGKVIKVVIERDRSPFEAREIATIGLRQGLLGECVYEDCVIDPANVIEARRGGTEVLKASWSVNRPLFGLIAANLAQRAYEIALDYARTRKQFGKPIAAHQLVQKNLSDIVTSITASRLLCLQALWQVDQGMEAAGTSAMAKRFAQESCREAVFQAMNLLGAMGLSEEARIEEIYRDIRMIPVPDGTNEILALIHGRELTGFEAFRGTQA